MLCSLGVRAACKTLLSSLPRYGAFRSASTGVVLETSEDMPHSLSGLRILCDGAGDALRSKWREVESSLTNENTQEIALSQLIRAACGANDLHRARRICLRRLALREQHSTQDTCSDSRSVDNDVWCALIGAHARCGDADAGFAMLSRFANTSSAAGSAGAESATLGQDIPRDVLEELVKGLAASGRTDLAFDLFQRMRTWALAEPSSELYVVLIHAYGRIREPESAQALFEELRKSCSPARPPCEARAALIVALASRFRTTKAAFKAFSEAMRFGDPVSMDVFQALASACARGGLAQEAKLLQRRMLAAGFRPDVRMQASLVRALSVAAVKCVGFEGAVEERERLFAHAWRLVGEAREAGTVSTQVIAPLLGAYCDAGLVDHAEKLLGMYSELTGAPAGVDAFASLLQAASGEPQRFKHIWVMMERRTGEQPTDEMLREALNVAISSKDVTWARSVLEVMYTRRLALGSQTVEAVRALSRLPSATRQELPNYASSQSSQTTAHALRALLNAF